MMDEFPVITGPVNSHFHLILENHFEYVKFLLFFHHLFFQSIEI